MLGVGKKMGRAALLTGTVSLGCQLVLVDDFGGIHPWKEVRYGKDLVDLVKGTSFKTELETPYS